VFEKYVSNSEISTLVIQRAMTSSNEIQRYVSQPRKQ